MLVCGICGLKFESQEDYEKHIFHMIFRKGATSFSRGIAVTFYILLHFLSYRGRGQPASCLRCADDALKAMRAVQCGRLAADAHTSLTKPEERKRTQPKHAVNAQRRLQAPSFSLRVVDYKNHRWCGIKTPRTIEQNPELAGKVHEARMRGEE